MGIAEVFADNLETNDKFFELCLRCNMSSRSYLPTLQSNVWTATEYELVSTASKGLELGESVHLQKCYMKELIDLQVPSCKETEFPAQRFCWVSLVKLDDRFFRFTGKSGNLSRHCHIHSCSISDSSCLSPNEALLQ